MMKYIIGVGATLISGLVALMPTWFWWWAVHAVAGEGALVQVIVAGLGFWLLGIVQVICVVVWVLAMLLMWVGIVE